MTEDIVILLFSLDLLDGKLKFALNFAHKQIVYDDVISWIVEFVLDSDQFELSFHGWTVVKEVHGLKDADEGAFAALIL
jgi:hypothetical protein